MVYLVLRRSACWEWWSRVCPGCSLHSPETGTTCGAGRPSARPVLPWSGSERDRKVRADLIKTNQMKGLHQCCNDWLIVRKKIFIDLLKSAIYMFLSITSQFLLGENGDDNGLFVSKISWSDGLKFKAPIRGCWNHVPGWAQCLSERIR